MSDEPIDLRAKLPKRQTPIEHKPQDEEQVWKYFDRTPKGGLTSDDPSVWIARDFTVREAAWMMGLSPFYMRRLVTNPNSDAFPNAYLINRARGWRIPGKDLAEFIISRRKGPKPRKLQRWTEKDQRRVGDPPS